MSIHYLLFFEEVSLVLVVEGPKCRIRSLSLQDFIKELFESQEPCNEGFFSV